MPTLPLRLVLRWAATLALGGAGGVVATLVGAPLPWLLGALGASGAAAAFGLRLAGGAVAFPVAVRVAFVPVIGVLIGGAVTPALLQEARGWWPALIATPLFVVAAHGVNYALMRRFGGLSKATAFFAGMPGGLIESIELGEKAGADPRALTVLQFARIAITVTVVPLVFSLIEGRAVGSAGGASFAAAAPLALRDVVVLTGAGVLGVFGARALRLPAHMILGPVLLSGLAHGLGLTHASPPVWLAALAQTVIGVSLGVRFVGVAGSELRRWFALSALSVAAMLALGWAFALALAALGVAPAAASLLGLAPGGVVEMGLVALSLQASPIYVTAMHLVRILATVWVAVALWRRIGPG